MVLLTHLSGAREFVFALATNYNAAVLEPFLISARLSGYYGDIWLGVNAKQLASLPALFSRWNATMMQVDDLLAALNSTQPLLTKRFRIFSLWSAGLSDNDRILISDVRDVFFQANPFAVSTAPLNIFLEDTRKTIGSCAHNSRWIRDCFGTSVLTQLANHSIACAGNLMGTTRFVREACQMIFDAVPKYRKCSERNVNDQGTLNYVYYKIWYSNTSIKAWPRGTGPVNTVGYANLNASHFAQNGFLLNADRRWSSVVHQYDRQPMLRRVYADAIRAAKIQWLAR